MSNGLVGKIGLSIGIGASIVGIGLEIASMVASKGDKPLADVGLEQNVSEEIESLASPQGGASAERVAPKVEVATPAR